MPKSLLYSTASAEYRHYLTRARALTGKDPDVPLRGTNVQTQSPLLSIEIDLLEAIYRLELDPHTEQDRKDQILLKYCEAAARLAYERKELEQLMSCYIAIVSSLAGKQLTNEEEAFSSVGSYEMNAELEKLEEKSAALQREIGNGETDLSKVNRDVMRLEKRLINKRSELENLKMLCGQQ